MQGIVVTSSSVETTYSEPEAMKTALIEKGIPEASVVGDFAEFLTLDSVVRAREIFDQSDYLLISQPFHNERAVCVGQQYGMKPTGFNTPDVEAYGGWKTKFREKPARVKTLTDLHLTDKKLKLLGGPISIGIASYR